MPFKSEAQRKWMYANDPKMAKKWQEHTPKGKKLPKKVEKKSSALGTAGVLAAVTAPPALMYYALRRAAKNTDFKANMNYADAVMDEEERLGREITEEEGKHLFKQLSTPAGVNLTKRSCVIPGIYVEKAAGYFQNVVGFNDLNRFKKLRDKALAAEAAEDEAYDAIEQAQLKGGWTRHPYDTPEYKAALPLAQKIAKKWWADNPDKDYDALRKQFTATALSGKDIGVTGKYNSIPTLVGNQSKEWYADMPTGAGYLSKADILNHPDLQDERMAPYMDTAPPIKNKRLAAYMAAMPRHELVSLAKIKASPYKYFTSTQAG